MTLFDTPWEDVEEDIVPPAQLQENICPPLPESAHLPADMGVHASEWLNNYLTYTGEMVSEAHRDFHTACGIWILSLATAGTCYVETEIRKTFPALAIAFTSPNALYGADDAAQTMIDLVCREQIGHYLADSKAPPQHILTSMTGQDIPLNAEELNDTLQDNLRTRLEWPGQRGLYYENLKPLTKALQATKGAEGDFARLLRSFDKGLDTFTFSAPRGKSATIIQPYLPLFVTTRQQEIAAYVQSEPDFWQDDFWTRFAFITAPAQPLVAHEPDDFSVFLDLHHLSMWIGTNDPSLRIKIYPIKDARGRCIGHTITHPPLPDRACEISDEVLDEAMSNYQRALREIMLSSDNRDLDLFYRRLPDTALKIALLLAVSDAQWGDKENSKEVEMKHWARAQEITEMMRRHLHIFHQQVTAGKTSQSIATTSMTLEEALITYLQSLQGRKVTIREINRFGPRMLRKSPAEELRTTLFSLAEHGDVVTIVESNTERYQIPPLHSSEE